VSLVVESPFRGSEFFERTTVFNSGDVHVSEIVIIGRSLPTAPMGKVTVVREPSAKIQSMVCVPRDSCENCGRCAWLSAKAGDTGAIAGCSASRTAVGALVDWDNLAPGATGGGTLGKDNLCAVRLRGSSV